jgi:hypothetical protein
MKRYLSLVLILLTITAAGCERQPSEQDLEVPPSLSSAVERAKTVDFCTLVRDSLHYDKNVVRTKATFFRDLENAYLYDRSCGQNAYVWVELEPAYAYSNAEIKKKFEQLYCSKQPCSDDNALVTVVGRFEGPTGGPYGHLDGYRFRFSVMRIERVDEPESIASPSK